MIDRAAAIRRFGRDPIACSTLQPGLEYFDASFGFIAFRRVLGMDITLGPPVCAADDEAELLDRFVRTRKRPILCYVEANTLTEARLGGRRLYCAGMGADKDVDLEALLDDPAAAVQSASRKAQRAGFSVRELDLRALDARLAGRVQSITRTFVARSQVPVEMAFLNRPMSLHPDGLRRVFALQRDDEPFGYTVLNPWFRDDAVAGYLLDIVRFEPTRIWGVYLATVMALARQLAREGVALSLGFCPLWRVSDPPDERSLWLQTQVRWLARSLREVEYVKRLHGMKSLLPGPVRPRFFASFSRNALSAFVALVGACGVSLRTIFGPDLVRAIARSRSRGGVRAVAS
jgi:lysylphosphatidylglycerol synthetase-like protein (DUF2156 family)